MFCRQCGSKLDEDAKFCRKCGTATGMQAVLSNMDNANAQNGIQSNSKVIGRIVGVVFLLIGIITIMIFALIEYDLYISEWKDASDSYNKIFTQCVTKGYVGELSDILDVAREPLDEIENEMLVKGCIGGGFGLLCIVVAVVFLIKSKDRNKV